jgi:hypothetical protein
MDNYRLTLVDLKNVGHKDDLWVLPTMPYKFSMYSIQKLENT